MNASAPTHWFPSKAYQAYQVIALPLYSDNYAWLIHNTTDAWIIDPGQADPVAAVIQELGVTLQGMLVTHRHWDHVNGIEALFSLYPVPVYGSADIHPGITHPLIEGDNLTLGGLSLQVWETPGHTADHLGFYIEEAGWFFCGDTLFSAGCGRLKQTGNMQDLFNSLQRIASLPGQTELFCSHEYTLSNLAFAQSIEPNNLTIKKRIEHAEELRAENTPSIPSTLEQELSYNPFLRLGYSDIIDFVEKTTQEKALNAFEIFKYLRQQKDNY